MKPFVSTVRNKGIRLIIYLDDMVIVSSTRGSSLEDTASVIHVLESLGFLVNREKSMLVPSQTAEFLGFVIETVEMTVSLPERKIIRGLNQATCLRRQAQRSVRELAHFIGLVVSSFPAIKPARLYDRDLELCKLDALSWNEGNYDSVFCLSEKANYALGWFISSCRLYNGTCFAKPKSVITLFTDAPKSGWGVLCNEVSTSGLWSSNEQALHINCLELIAILLGVQCFVQSRYCLVKVFCDNSTAISYINNLGGMVPSLHAVSKSIWEWCLSHHSNVPCSWKF